MIGWIILIIVVVVVGYAIIAYNNLVRQRQLTQEGWSGIDVQLKRRADLIPNLLESVKGYMAHERETLEAVTQARTAAVAGQNGTPEQRAQLEGALSQALGKLFAVAEAYPDLKADDNFRQLQSELSAIEEQLQGARRYYNATVRDLNSSIQSFPNVLFARPLGFSEAEFYADADASIQQAPKVSFGAAQA